MNDDDTDAVKPRTHDREAIARYKELARLALERELTPEEQAEAAGLRARDPGVMSDEELKARTDASRSALGFPVAGAARSESVAPSKPRLVVDNTAPSDPATSTDAEKPSDDPEG